MADDGNGGMDQAGSDPGFFDTPALPAAPLPPPDPLANLGPTERFILEQAPGVISDIQAGAVEASDIVGQGLQQAITGLQPFTGTEAFDEQQALLGVLGPEAQQAAIQGIPISEFQRANQERESRTLARQQALTGSRGGGAALLGRGQLAGARESQNVFNRVNQLQELSDISRLSRSQISQLTEDARARQAAITGGVGQTASNLLLGVAPAITGERAASTELQGLQDIGQANIQGALANQAIQGLARSDIFQPSAPLVGQSPLVNVPAPSVSSTFIPGADQQTLVF